jgi:hypothetical protein
MLFAFLYKLDGGDNCPLIAAFMNGSLLFCAFSVFLRELLWYFKETFGLNYELIEEVG